MLTFDEARRIAVNVAKLPRLLGGGEWRMRRALLVAVMLALYGCDDIPKTPDEQAWRQTISECMEKTEKRQDADYIIACMDAAGFEPLNEDEAADICFSQHIYDTPGCWVQR